MPQLGEKAHANEIGRETKDIVWWVKCPECGLERWVCLRKQRNTPPPKEPIKMCPPCRLKEWLKTRNYKESGHPNWKGGRCDTGNGYIRVRAPDHPRAHQGYIREHILVWEQTHNMPLPKGYIVHHINGIKNDNSPKNLLALPNSGHSPSLFVKEVQKRLREVEAELAQRQMF